MSQSVLVVVSNVGLNPPVVAALGLVDLAQTKVVFLRVRCQIGGLRQQLVDGGYKTARDLRLLSNVR
jgi:hypothetical protein